MGAALQSAALPLPASGTCGVSCRQCSKGLDELAIGRKKKGKFRRNALVRNGSKYWITRTYTEPILAEGQESQGAPPPEQTFVLFLYTDPAALVLKDTREEV